MFLDEKLFKIGKTVDLRDDESIRSTAIKLFKTAMEDIVNIEHNNDTQRIIAQFKRVNKSYKLAITNLKEIGIDCFNLEGFKNAIEKTELKGILKE